ncbi:type IV pilin [Halorubrum ezzemoulense]|uniref:type IV pilin n=1 Tax=Halorubrum ezzemoulense TaxID=337243 RepID=UPI00374339CB
MSPVIGVILMVAITVILAAVIGTFVLGLGDQIGGSATAGVTIDGDNTSSATVTLTNTGTANNVAIRYAENGTDIKSGVSSSGTNPLNNTGSSITINTTGNYTVVATSDNGESVLRSFRVS